MVVFFEALSHLEAGIHTPIYLNGHYRCETSIWGPIYIFQLEIWPAVHANVWRHRHKLGDNRKKNTHMHHAFQKN